MFGVRVRIMQVVAIGFVAASCGNGTLTSSPSAPTGAPTTTPTAAASAAPQPTGGPASASPSAIGRLLFSRLNEATDTFVGMYTSATDGSDERSIPLPGPEGGGRWSNGGDHIAVMTLLPDGRVGTAILGADGELLRTLEIPDPALNLACTLWTPDDDRLVCEAWDETDGARGGLYAVDALDGGNVRRLTTPPTGLMDLPGDVAPDGRVLFKRAAEYDQAGELLFVDRDGTESAPAQPVVVGEPGRVSPDGASIAVGDDCEIVILGIDGAEIDRFGEAGRCIFGPQWSPDGAWIVYSSGANGPFADLVISRPDGTERSQATTTPENEIGVDWAP